MRAKFANEKYIQEISELFRSIERTKQADLEWAELMICIIIGKILSDNSDGVSIIIEKTDFV